MSRVAGTPEPARESLSVARGDLDLWLELLLRDHEVIAPVADPDGEVIFRPISAPREVSWEFDNPLLPPKAYLLPQTEPLFRVAQRNGRHQLEAEGGARPRLLFNLRSCDASALAYLRAVFAADLPDNALLRRADALTIVTLACAQPCRDGFCACCAAGPFLTAGFDIQLTDLGSRFLAEPGSEKGCTLLARAGSLFRAASGTELERRVAAEVRAREGFGEETCHFASAMRRISTGRVPAELWEAAGGECFECGGCTLVCPTCYCFSVRDREVSGGWERCRVWDSCQYRAFTLEASGHNPREHRSDRIKRRFFHKVSAQYFQREGTVGCVGCGRCIQVCLGTPDMPAVVGAIRRGEWHG
ncbi:MAG: 4Fe-4S dicluster domain-containing protein [Acidobacteriota bacterium]